MNDFQEKQLDFQEIPNQGLDLANLQNIEMDSNSVTESVTDYCSSVKEIAKDVFDGVSDFVHDIKETICDVLGLNDSKDVKTVSDATAEYHDAAREYGIKECSDSAKQIFTPEVINEWGMMTPEQRNDIVQQYAEALGEGLDINVEGVVWEDFSTDDGTYTFGYNAGDGYIHLNTDFLTNPGMIMQLVDTVAHEARHQFQTEVIENPEKFGIDQETVNEWAVGRQIYTTAMPSSFDPWGYTYNPLEIDSQYFGQSMVRELTKDLINS